MLPNRESLAIAEIIIYIPLLLVTILVLARHGRSKSLGWIYLFSFVATRISGAAVAIASAKNPTNHKLEIWTGLLDSAGVGPLLLAGLGLLKRIIDQTSTHVRSQGRNKFMEVLISHTIILRRLIKRLEKRVAANSRRSRLIELIQIPALVAEILCIVGETNTTESEHSQAESQIKASIVIFLVIYLTLCVLTIYSATDMSKLPREERLVLFTVLFSLPLLCVRILWSLLTVFGHLVPFSKTNYNIIARVFMVTLEELMIVIVMCYVGFRVPKVSMD